MANSTVYQHGVVTTISGSSLGKVQSIKFGKSVSTDLVLDESGNVIDYIDFNKIYKVDIEITLAKLAGATEPGDILTITPVSPSATAFKIKVDTVDDDEVNEKTKTRAISGRNFASNNIPA